MDDSDEYVFDDIILDEKTLATLDQQERNFLGESSHANSTSTSEPVTKRFKTNNGWTPGPGAHIKLGVDYDEMPEISLQRDGSYGVGNPVNALTVSMPKLAERKSERFIPSDNYPVTFGHLETDFSRGITQAQNMLSGLSTSRQPLYANNRPNGENSRTSFRRSEPVVNNHEAITSNPDQLQAQMSELQKKLDELREENSKIQTALQDAVDVKLAKEGEVSILRRSIEKTSQIHAAQIAQLKADKEKVDLRQAQMQKEMKDELERLRTQFVFKQQELESSIRKPLGSVRAKKVVRELPSTPLPIPHAMRSWNLSGTPNSRRAVEDTPVPPPLISRISPSKYRKSPEKQRKISMLPGFQNAFETSTSTRSPSKRINKGKGKMDYGPLAADATFYNTSRDLSQQCLDALQSPLQDGINTFQDSEATPLFPIPLTLELGQAKCGDMDAALISDENGEASIPLDSIEDADWKLELSRIILTHSHPACDSIVFQHLLGLSGSIGSFTKYTASCGRILEVVASSSSKADYEECLHTISRPLLSILAAISEMQQLNSLAMLLDLLRELILSLPKFRVVLLCSRIENEGGDTFLLDILSKIILDHMQPTKTHIHRDTLAKEILSLLESLCFSVSPEAIEKLESMLRNREILMVLMHTSQPAWLLDQSSRLSVLLSTHHTLFRVFLNISNPDIIQNTGAEGIAKNPLIECLCSHLIERGGSEPEAYKLQILACFAQLSIAHSEAHAALAASYVLIPSLILFITNLTTPLWEDDGKLSSSPSITSSIIRTLNQTITLLYSLIFRTEPALNLRHTLQHAPNRPFNSISNIFVVTFGRLSYCDPPGWIDAKKRQELENLSELAREILEVVVDGPDGDNVWAAFQTEPEEDGALDDEEIEARRMGIEA